MEFILDTKLESHEIDTFHFALTLGVLNCVNINPTSEYHFQESFLFI